MTELTLLEKKAILTSRFNALSDRELQFMDHVGFYVDKTLSMAMLEESKSLWKDKVEYFWSYSTLGEQYSLWSKDKMEDLDKRLKALEAVYARKKWGGVIGRDRFNLIVKGNEVTPFIFFTFVRRFSQEDRNVFETYMKDPMFSVGQIVQLRANAGTDSVLTAHKYQHTSRYYYGCGARELIKAKKKTFMVIGIDPKIEGTIYAKIYKYKEKQGGCRYYKLLPMGEQKTYIVVEKFMKKCRTKAVKDARK